MEMTRIVITGGPCAGKSTAMSWIQNTFTQMGYTVLFVPETATELISDLKKSLTMPNEDFVRIASLSSSSPTMVFSGDEKPKQIETLFSRYEEYALYVGLDFNPNNVEYAKVFIRFLYYLIA